MHAIPRAILRGIGRTAVALGRVAHRAGWRGGLAILGTAALLGAPWWGPRALARLSFFRARAVVVVGARYVSASDIVALLRVDTTASIWDDPTVLEQRVLSHPAVRAVEIGRRLPGTLVVRLTEREPVALVPGPDGLRAVDSSGRVLPLDPARSPVDLPVLADADTGVLRLLSVLQARDPALYGRVSAVRHDGGGQLVLRMERLTVRADTSLTARRLADIIPVETDLSRRGAAVAELDLRFREQVIARLQ